MMHHVRVEQEWAFAAAVKHSVDRGTLRIGPKQIKPKLVSGGQCGQTRFFTRGATS